VDKSELLNQVGERTSGIARSAGKGRGKGPFSRGSSREGPSRGTLGRAGEPGEINVLRGGTTSLFHPSPLEGVKKEATLPVRQGRARECLARPKAADPLSSGEREKKNAIWA